ncbi:MAG: glycosyltransferase [Kiritimatiellae bacterium]|nr:glycosyltransferase [Kiritimatiellia bacterium]
MKVIQVVPSIGKESAGPSYSVPGLCRGLQTNDVTTELHFLDAIPEHLLDVTYQVENYPRQDKINLGWSPKMLQGLKRTCQTADIIHNNGLWMMPNVYPLWACKGTKCKLVVAPRGTLAEWSLKKGWLKKKIFGWFLQNAVLRHADMFHATCEKEYEEIRAQGYKQPVAIVPIGMDLPTLATCHLPLNTIASGEFCSSVECIRSKRLIIW